MVRVCQGIDISLEDINAAYEEIHKLNEKTVPTFNLARLTELNHFGYLFPSLQNDAENLLFESNDTVGNLIALGKAMEEKLTDSGEEQPLDSTIPSAYTYLGQFIAHDISLEIVSKELPDITAANLKPLDLNSIDDNSICTKIKNGRSAALDLDSIYDYPAPRNGQKMEINRVGKAAFNLGRPLGKDDFNDLPRRPFSTTCPALDRQALIGDARNDENLILAQLHVAFLRTHNVLIDRGYTFYEARTLLRQHYQWIVVEDYLKRIADPAIVERVRDNGNQVFFPFREPFFMPLEFSVATYRFGHSMVRASYNYNSIFGKGTGLKSLFNFTAQSGNLAAPNPANGEQPNYALPENWIIQWENFVNVGGENNAARLIDTLLVEPLFYLPDENGKTLRSEAKSLAVRNLLRGYLLRMPTGQAVASALNFRPLSPRNIKSVVTDKQRQILEQTKFKEFLTRTPLWFYILAEAAYRKKIVNDEKDHLGPVGSTIVAEVLMGLVRRSKDSILTQHNRNWKPTLGSTPGQFTLADLLKLAGTLP